MAANGPEFVGGIGHELPDPGLGLLSRGKRAGNILEHLVQRRPDLTDLGAGICIPERDPDTELDLPAVQRQHADPTGGCRDPIQWRQ